MPSDVYNALTPLSETVWRRYVITPGLLSRGVHRHLAALRPFLTMGVVPLAERILPRLEPPRHSDATAVPTAFRPPAAPPTIQTTTTWAVRAASPTIANMPAGSEPDDDVRPTIGASVRVARTTPGREPFAPPALLAPPEPTPARVEATNEERERRVEAVARRSPDARPPAAARLPDVSAQRVRTPETTSARPAPRPRAHRVAPPDVPNAVAEPAGLVGSTRADAAPPSAAASAPPDATAPHPAPAPVPALAPPARSSTNRRVPPALSLEAATGSAAALPAAGATAIAPRTGSEPQATRGRASGPAPGPPVPEPAPSPGRAHAPAGSPLRPADRRGVGARDVTKAAANRDPGPVVARSEAAAPLTRAPAPAAAPTGAYAASIVRTLDLFRARGSSRDRSARGTAPVSVVAGVRAISHPEPGVTLVSEPGGGPPMTTALPAPAPVQPRPAVAALRATGRSVDPSAGSAARSSQPPAADHNGSALAALRAGPIAAGPLTPITQSPRDGAARGSLVDRGDVVANLDDLEERLWRRLLSRLAIEQERRGHTRWP